MTDRPILLARSTGSEEPLRVAVEHHDRMLRRAAPAVRVGTVVDLTVSYGVGVAETASYLERARRDGVATIRRSSGGSGIVHAPGDLVWAVVLPRSDPRVGRDFVRAYDRLGQGLVTWLADHGRKGAWVPAPGVDAWYCPLSSRGFVLDVDGQVLAAAAQHVTPKALLHHGTLPRALVRPSLGRWFALRSPGALDRLTSLEDLGISAVHASEVAEHLARALEGRG